MSEVTIETDIATIQNIQTININENGEYELLPQEPNEYITKAEVNVNVPAPEIKLENKQITISENGEQTVSADSNYDGLGTVIINANIPNQTEEINITENGEYTPPSPNIGYNSVTVNVPQSGKINLKYLSLVSEGQTSDGLGRYELNLNNWLINSSNKVINYKPPEGHVLCIYKNNNNMYSFVLYTRSSTGATTFDISPGEKYVDFNYDIGNKVFLLDENNKNVIEFNVATYYNAGGGGVAAYTYKWCGFLINPNHFNLV